LDIGWILGFELWNFLADLPGNSIRGETARQIGAQAVRDNKLIFNIRLKGNINMFNVIYGTVAVIDEPTVAGSGIDCP
jgi:hypothetical protein